MMPLRQAKPELSELGYGEVWGWAVMLYTLPTMGYGQWWHKAWITGLTPKNVAQPPQ